MESSLQTSLSVYAVSDDGEHFKVSYKGSETLEAEKNNSQVLVFADVVKRQIWIWTGSTAPVRKRFVGSRVAQALRFEVGTVKGTQSIEQGDEPQSFWDFIEGRTTAGLVSQETAPDQELSAVPTPDPELTPTSDPEPTPIPKSASKGTKKSVAVFKSRRKSTPAPEPEPEPEPELKKKTKKGSKKKTRKTSKASKATVSEKEPVSSTSESPKSEYKTFLDSFLKTVHIPKKRISISLKKDINPGQAILISGDFDLTLSIDKIVYSASNTTKIPLYLFEVDSQERSINLSNYPPTLVLYAENGKSSFLDLNLKPKPKHQLYLAGPSNSFLYIEFKK